MRVLITGGAGFIGSHLVLRWLRAHPGDEVVNLDKLSYASDLRNLAAAEADPRYRLVVADLADRPTIREAVRNLRPDGVLHLAAESHVDNSINDPGVFVASNVVGTFNLLEECRQLWKETPATFASHRFLHVSTDEVYGTLGGTGTFDESSPYQPNSPYSASKAGSDHLVRSYHHTFGLNTVVTHCSNNFGPHQHLEKLIPTVIRCAVSHKPIPVYGAGQNIRDWLYVEDHCHALELAFLHGQPGSVYDIGADNEWRNIDLAARICELLDEMADPAPHRSFKELMQFVKDRPGHDFRYAIDSRKIQDELGWRKSPDFDECLRRTIQWYVGRMEETR
jgi:dTDP-glucose 4,6-dehydratase